MKIPPWAYAVGILMILFGGCGIVRNVATILTSSIPKFEAEVERDHSWDVLDYDSDSLSANSVDSLSMDDISSEQDGSGSEDQDDTGADDEINSGNDDAEKYFGDSITKMFSSAETLRVWGLRFSYIGLILKFIYIIGGIFLMVRKTFSINLAIVALGISILFSITQGVVLGYFTGSGIAILFVLFSYLFGIIIDVIFMVIILMADKSAYTGQQDIRHQIPRPL